MKTYTQDELESILDKHKLWLLNEDGGERADLSDTNLSGVNLSGVNLRSSNLYRANLCNANLLGVDLCSANLCGADLLDADLSGANLSDSDLSGADLSGANLCSADLRRANLSGVDLHNTNLSQASTQEVVGIRILSVDNIGSYNGKVTYVPHLDVVFAGCWKGTLNEFLKKGKAMNENDPEKTKQIELVYALFETERVDQ